MCAALVVSNLTATQGARGVAVTSKHTFSGFRLTVNFLSLHYDKRSLGDIVEMRVPASFRLSVVCSHVNTSFSVSLNYVNDVYILVLKERPPRPHHWAVGPEVEGRER